MQEFVVTKQEAGRRLDKYLKKLLPQAASGFLYKMLRKKNITLNDKKATGNEVIAAGDTVKLFFSRETYQKFSGKLPAQENAGQTAAEEPIALKAPLRLYRKAFHELQDISVIYEDDDILILNKPTGVLAQKAEKDDISLNEWLIGYLLEREEITEAGLERFRPSVCNRLDRNTSGLMLCGKSVRGSQFLSEILRDRSLHKYYLAYVQGKIEHSVTLKGYLKKEEEKNRSAIVSEGEYQQAHRQKISSVVMAEKQQDRILGAERTEKGYQKIETVIKPISYIEEKDCTKLEILLVTGKSHQIRAHLASIGHPVLGDRKYGWKPKRKEDAALKYQLLHAYRVEFPETEGEFRYLSGKSVTAPAPKFFGEYKGNTDT